MRPLRPLLAWTLVTALLVPLSVRFVDRPVARWAHETFHGVEHTHWLALMADPIPGLAVAAAAAALIARRLGWRPGRFARLVILCVVATLVATLFKDVLKYACGRTWPETWAKANPSFIQNGVYGFFPFHGGVGWSSFPSGHTGLTAAPMGVLAEAAPRWRWLWLAPVGLVGAGLVAADYHFVSDVLAGAWLGLVTGTLTWRLGRRRLGL